MARRITLLLKNVALVYEPLNPSQPFKSNQKLCTAEPNNRYGVCVIPTALYFGASGPSAVNGKASWNGLFSNGKDLCA
jgi:hypothetical protein